MKPFRGIYAILVTPYKKDFTLDTEDIARQTEFCIRGGAHGIVVPVNASEFFFLNDAERKEVVRVTAETAAGRIPVIAGVAAPTQWLAAEFAAYAGEVGADGVIAMPPYIVKADMPHILDYYKAIADACELPVFIQNYVAPIGTPLSAEALCKIIEQVDGVEYVKEETAIAGHVMTALIALAKTLPEGRFKGIMGGKACRYLIDEYMRGACGCMPACEICDVQSRVWDLLDEGKTEEGIALYEKTIPILNMEYTYGASVYKEVLYRRGIIKTTLSRGFGSMALDAQDHKELDRILRDLEPNFRV